MGPKPGERGERGERGGSRTLPCCSVALRPCCARADVRAVVLRPAGASVLPARCLASSGTCNGAGRPAAGLALSVRCRGASWPRPLLACGSWRRGCSDGPEAPDCCGSCRLLCEAEAEAGAGVGGGTADACGSALLACAGMGPASGTASTARLLPPLLCAFLELDDSCKRSTSLSATPGPPRGKVSSARTRR